MNSPLAPLHLSALRADLLAWYGRVRRDLPWRAAGSLYATWISEVMLQQTTVAAVVPYYRRFLARFPDVQALAAASQEEVLACWSGLGYYSRARLLHRAARLVVAESGGTLPRSREDWAALPGVGAYTSGAIASIGLGERVAAIDANARRVITRWCIGDVDELRTWTAAAVARAGAGLVDPADPGTWNQAVMELGALVCRPEAPRCPVCPVKAHCRARAAGLSDTVPLPSRREPLVDVALAALVITWAGRVLLVPPGSGPAVLPVCGLALFRDDFQDLHRGMWSLPITAWYRKEQDAGGAAVEAALQDPHLWSSFLREIVWPAPPLLPGAVCGVQRHTITRHRLRVAVHRLALTGSFCRDAGIPGPQSKKDLMDEGIPVYNHQGMAGRFFPWPHGTVPVTRLVTKCLQTAGQALG